MRERERVKGDRKSFWLIVVLTAVVAAFLLVWNAKAYDIPSYCQSGFVGPLTVAQTANCAAIAEDEDAASKPEYCSPLFVGPLTVEQEEACNESSGSVKDPCENTTIIKVECGENGEGIQNILNLIMQILTVGVGIAAVLGVTIAAIIYTTAGGDESKTKLAKTMIFNIVIGLILYVLLWALLNFILPNQIEANS
ncbi:MAG: pilin [Candidatus Nomurabacteria bacterium]|jgi:hypothetical protein|nr:pilin [Candidatus Nomurabacteria bacterium]